MALILLLTTIVALALAWANARDRRLPAVSPSSEAGVNENDPHSDADAQDRYEAKRED